MSTNSQHLMITFLGNVMNCDNVALLTRTQLELCIRMVKLQASSHCHNLPLASHRELYDSTQLCTIYKLHIVRLMFISTYTYKKSKKLGHFYFYCNFGKCWSIFTRATRGL